MASFAPEQVAPSMLEKVSAERLPTEAEMDAASKPRGNGLEAIEHLALSLRRAIENDGEGVDVTAEQAWHITQFAEYVRLDAEEMLRNAGQIREDIEQLYHWAQERQQAAERKKD